MKQLFCLLLIGLFGVSCQPGNQNGSQPAAVEHPAGDSPRKDSVSEGSAASKDTLKTTDSLQSPSFP